MSNKILVSKADERVISINVDIFNELLEKEELNNILTLSAFFSRNKNDNEYVDIHFIFNEDKDKILEEIKDYTIEIVEDISMEIKTDTQDTKEEEQQKLADEEY